MFWWLTRLSSLGFDLGFTFQNVLSQLFFPLNFSLSLSFSFCCVLRILCLSFCIIMMHLLSWFPGCLLVAGTVLFLPIVCEWSNDHQIRCSSNVNQMHWIDLVEKALGWKLRVWVLDKSITSILVVWTLISSFVNCSVMVCLSAQNVNSMFCVNLGWNKTNTFKLFECP